jgi:carboxymethylenebutenolidase
MGEIVEFPSNGTTGSGYFAPAEGGSGPGVLVIQEWWGLVPHITDICDRFAAEGFSALAPDLYRGTTTTEPDEAGKLMMALNLERAARDLRGAADHLLGLDAVTGSAVGVTGFCMGGGLTLVAACAMPDVVAAAVPWYGLIPWPDAEPDWSAMRARVLGHYAERDGFFTPEAARALEATLVDLGKDATVHIYPGADHAFFNDTRPEVYQEANATLAWDRTIAFLRDTLA